MMTIHMGIAYACSTIGISIYAIHERLFRRAKYEGGMWPKARGFMLDARPGVGDPQIQKPDSIYVGYNERRHRSGGPSKPAFSCILHDFPMIFLWNSGPKARIDMEWCTKDEAGGPSQAVRRSFVCFSWLSSR